LLLGECSAEGLALERALAHQLECALHLSEPAHDVVDPTWAEPLLRDQEAMAPLPEEVLRRHAHLGVTHFAVRRPAATAMTEDRDRFDLDSRCIGRNDDLAHPVVRRIAR